MSTLSLNDRGAENKKARQRRAFLCFGSSTWARTRDLRINSPALYQLSYRGSNLAVAQRCNDVPTKTKASRERGHRFDILGSPTWARTRDLRINSPALYQLSYRGSKEKAIIVAVFTHCQHSGRIFYASGMRVPPVALVAQRSSRWSFSLTSFQSSASGSDGFVLVMLGQPGERSALSLMNSCWSPGTSSSA